ncbi:MAG: SAM-dependent methyltransferase, partial [Tannerella sp.]|nr:SAM-dependent methyltransferase [Tannerella sp.]
MEIPIFAPVEMTDHLRIFIRDHAEDDVLQLVLNASRYKGVDVRFAAGQIAARRRIKDKLPEWYANDGLIYPSPLAAEQCSSRQTALYKQRLVGEEDCVCDLTGGLGADAYFLSLRAKSLTYVERNASYCEAAEYNMKQLGARNVHVLNEDAVELITERREELSGVNVFYLDPARRGSGNERRFALQDCEPDLTKLWPLLRNETCRVIAKLSPMLDIKRLLSQLTGIREIHVVSVR